MSASLDTRRAWRVLIADDVPSLLSWAERAFRRAGWEVTIAIDGAAAWAAWQEAHRSVRTPDLLLTDLNMPGLDGPTLIEHVRALCPEAPVLVLTGLATDRLKWDRATPHRMRLMRKPVTGADLITAAGELVTQDVVDSSAEARA